MRVTPLHTCAAFNLTILEDNRTLLVTLKDMSSVGQADIDDYCTQLRSAYRRLHSRREKFAVAYDFRKSNLSMSVILRYMGQVHSLITSFRYFADEYVYCVSLICNNETVVGMLNVVLAAIPETAPRFITTDSKAWVRFIWESFKKVRKDTPPYIAWREEDDDASSADSSTTGMA